VNFGEARSAFKEHRQNLLPDKEQTTTKKSPIQRKSKQEKLLNYFTSW